MENSVYLGYFAILGLRGGYVRIFAYLPAFAKLEGNTSILANIYTVSKTLLTLKYGSTRGESILEDT